MLGLVTECLSELSYIIAGATSSEVHCVCELQSQADEYNIPRVNSYFKG